jgi:NTE family protein
MARIGLVLGAGGIVGQAHHAGVLTALEEQLDWDPRTAEVIVGSSAGSVTGAVLRLGASAHDLAAFVCDQPPSPEGLALFEALGQRELDFPPLGLRHLARPWRAPSPQLLARVARRPLAFRPGVAAATLLPTGDVDITEFTSVLDDGRGWPDGLLVCAARRSDGQRVVFGRAGSPEATLADAVAASCAIPAYFSPVTIGGVEHVDGGVHSPTSADLLAGLGLDLVVAVSPMSAAHGRSITPDLALRYAAHRRLCRELDKVRASGTPVLAFEPGRRSLRTMGLNAMADDRSAPVVRASYRETRERLAALGHDQRLRTLGGESAIAATAEAAA